jgi:hypothetical protein
MDMNDRFQDDLTRVMRDHEDEAPTTAELLVALRDNSRSAWSQARSGRHRRYIPLAAAAALAAVIAGSLWAGAQLADHGHRVTAVDHVPRLLCPARYAGVAPWVPAGPAGVSASARLVPRRVPRSAVICAYDGTNVGPQSGWKLSGRRSLTSGLAALTAQLTWQPGRRPLTCTAVGGRQVNYLIGLTYSGGGRLWVAATLDPNSCVGSSNGEFASSGVIGLPVTKAFRTGKWPVPGPESCHGGGPGVGRLGQDKAMVSPGVTSVTICGRGGRTIYAGYGRLIAALNALRTWPSTGSCTFAPGQHGPSYRLLFSYPEGPAVQVSINGHCSPQIDNLSLQSASARGIVPIIERLISR